VAALLKQAPLEEEKAASKGDQAASTAASAGIPQHWSCGSCGEQNSTDDPECQECGAENPEAGGGKKKGKKG
jgi:membrane protease subunit (stomatin/prohibitin family)